MKIAFVKYGVTVDLNIFFVALAFHKWGLWSQLELGREKKVTDY